MKYILSFLLLIGAITTNAQVCGNGICETGETAENCPDDCMIKIGIAFGDDFSDELFMPYIRELGADVSLIKLKWKDIEPYPPNHVNYVFNTTVLDNFLAQLQNNDTVLINIFTASDWATDQTCESNTQRKGCPLKDDATCISNYGMTCEQAYRNFVYKIVTHANNYLDSNIINAVIGYWQRDTEPATNTHFPPDEPEAYVDLQFYFYESVKNADTSAKVLGVCADGAVTVNDDVYGNLKPNNPSFFSYVIANAKDYFDLLDIRSYHNIYNIPQRLGWFIQEMDNNGYRKPVITTEGGGPTTMEFKDQLDYLSSWCYNNGYSTLDDIYDCMYEMDELGILPEELGIFMPYDPGNQTSILREQKVERMLCRDIIQRTFILLESNVNKHWRWNIRAKKRTFCTGTNNNIDVYGSPVFNKLAFLRYPGIICNSNSPTVPEKRDVPYTCYQRMQDILNNIRNIERVNIPGDTILFFYKIDKLDSNHIFVIWEKRDIFYGEDSIPTPISIDVGFNEVKITDVFGVEENRITDNGVLSLDITDTPLYIEDSQTNSVDDISFKDDNINIFPNPTTGIFTVIGENIQSIEIANIIGQVIKKFQVSGSKFQVNLSEHLQGIYFVKATTDKGIAVGKIVLE